MSLAKWESADSTLGYGYCAASHADGLTDALTEVPWMTGPLKGPEAAKEIVLFPRNIESVLVILTAEKSY